jgi:hypothetical protein
MQKLILYLSFLLFATTSNLFANPLSDTTLPWIDQVRDLRDAIYQRDKEKVKKYISFPVNGQSLWYIVKGEITDKTINTAPFDKLAENNSPLTEKLFDLYFDQLFYKKFITSFLKIKTKELYEKGETKTPKLSDDQQDFYQMSASFDAKVQTLTLNIYGHTIGNKDEDPEEYALIYTFVIIKGQLQLKEVLMPG